jgi:hypothetical protein
MRGDIYCSLVAKMDVTGTPPQHVDTAHLHALPHRPEGLCFTRNLMKSKPNTAQFKPAKDPSAFLEGGAADVANQIKAPVSVVSETKKPQTQTPPATKIHREQKIFRLPVDLIAALKRESYERSLRMGSRITETELVERSIKAYLSI